jgi:hypothetical protein
VSGQSLFGGQVFFAHVGGALFGFNQLVLEENQFENNRWN